MVYKGMQMNVRSASGPDEATSPGARISVVLMRGGTSKGVFVRDSDLPEAGRPRDDFLLALLGSPDPMQLDGLGGTHSSTSKVMAVRPSSLADTDVEYLFAQVGIDQPIVDYAGNCGNLTAAVGAYAVDEGLVPAAAPVTSVRMLNRNTGVRVIAHVPVSGGLAASAGDYYVDGVPTPGAPIVTEYLAPCGSVFGRRLPTGSPVDVVETPHGPLPISLVDAAHPMAFVRATDLGLTGTESPEQLNGDPEVLAKLEAVRAACAVRLGVVTDAADAAVAAATVPRLAIVAAHRGGSGTAGGAEPPHGTLIARMVSLGRVHHALAATGAICTAVATCVAGTVPHDLVSGPLPTQGDVRIDVEHPKGRVTTTVSLADEGESDVRSVSVVRTARRLLEGTALLPETLSLPASDRTSA